MKAFILMARAADNPKEYEGKRYKLNGFGLHDTSGNMFDEVFILKGTLRVGTCAFAFVCSETELEEIPQPVPFMEAVKAYSEGKAVICNVDKKSHKYIPSKDIEAEDNLGFLLEEYKGAVSSAEILRGKWTIEG